MKIAFHTEVSKDVPSSFIIQHFAQTTELIDPNHSVIGEQVGVMRTWRCAELREDEDVVSASARAWARLSGLISTAHHRQGSQHPVKDLNILL